MGLALISVGNIHVPALLYLDFAVIALARDILNCASCVAIYNYFEKV